MIKRLFDILIAGAALIVLSPLLFVVAMSVLLLSGRPVFFVQERPGYRGLPFRILKFRTMKNVAPGTGAEDDANRLTRFGQFLRTTSIDEIPELWNVLLGEMSLVGPRPLLMEYLDLYDDEQARRHDVRPGITGWAQVNGRNALSWEDKFKLDVWYVDNRSFRLDLRILWMTAIRVLRRDGISQDGHVTMEKFRGSN